MRIFASVELLLFSNFLKNIFKQCTSPNMDQVSIPMPAALVSLVN